MHMGSKGWLVISDPIDPRAQINKMVDAGSDAEVYMYSIYIKPERV